MNTTTCHWDFTSYREARYFANVLRYDQGVNTTIEPVTVTYRDETGNLYRVTAESPDLRCPCGCGSTQHHQEF